MALLYSFGEGTQLDKLFLTQLQLDLAALDASITANTAAIAAAIAKFNLGFEPGLIKQPQNQTYRIVERFPFAATISRFTVKLASGTCTAALQINGVAVGSCTLSATSSQNTVTATAPLTIAAADVIAITITSNSNGVDLSWQFDYTRT